MPKNARKIIEISDKILLYQFKSQDEFLNVFPNDIMIL